ncbi:putative ACR [Clostridiales bacterium oral taxon 876 str. F0540]|nr:putative ACR [Clostridiales bacterium oral taxon 876 str. F0540]
MIKVLKYNSVVLGKIFIADTFKTRFLGYMFRKKPHYEAILIKPCNSIHTFFMRFNIDVLFVDIDMKVVKKVENLPPRKIIMPVEGAAIVIEGKAGAFSEVSEGSKVSILN